MRNEKEIQARIAMLEKYKNVEPTTHAHVSALEWVLDATEKLYTCPYNNIVGCDMTSPCGECEHFKGIQLNEEDERSDERVESESVKCDQKKCIHYNESYFYHCSHPGHAELPRQCIKNEYNHFESIKRELRLSECNIQEQLEEFAKVFKQSKAFQVLQEVQPMRESLRNLDKEIMNVLNNMNSRILQWNKFFPGISTNLPDEKKYVLLLLKNKENMSNPITVGYLKYHAGSKTEPYFVIPGTAPYPVLMWCDCLPDDFEWPNKDKDNNNDIS